MAQIDESSKYYPMSQHKEITFLQSNPSEKDKSLLIKDPNEILNQNHVDNLYEHSEQIEEGSGLEHSQSEVSETKSKFSEANS